MPPPPHASPDSHTPPPGTHPADDPPAKLPPARRNLLAWAAVVALGAAVWTAGAWQAGTTIPPPGWRLLAVFLATILALMLHPIPGGAAVLMGIIASVLVGSLSLEDALTGYRDPSVWLVLAAFFLARAFLKTGLARRIALLFVRRLGHDTLGLSYALAASDTVLAAMIPSNAARVGGVLLPITRSLAELYQSRPGATAARLGTFLMLALYQCDVVACALFFTGQAGNALAAQQARELTDGVVKLSYANWVLYASLPALACLLVIPWLIRRRDPPQLTRTPEAVDMAARELDALGPLHRSEKILLAGFAGICAGWILLGSDAAALAFLAGESVARPIVALVGGDPTPLVALVGVAVLLLAGVLTWDDLVSEKAAWDVFIWYGGLVLLGKQLAKTGLLRSFAEAVAGPLGGWDWLPLFVALLIVYFYAHYAFASITTHLVALYPAFVPVLLQAGAPPWLTACAFAFVANLSAGLTHYGTTPGPIIFGLGYVPQGTWWRVGLRLSVVNLTIWLTVGMAWWKLLGLW